VRLCNIDVSDLVGSTGTQNAQQLIKQMIRMFARIPFPSMGTPVLYANRTVKEMLSVQALDKSQNALGIVEATRQFGGVDVGMKELQFFGVPIRTVDQILTTEARIV